MRPASCFGQPHTGARRWRSTSQPSITPAVSTTGKTISFTAAQPNPGARFALMGLFSGTCFLLTARTLAHGGLRQVPARYLLAGVMVVHGVWVLIRPLLFRLAAQSSMETQTGLLAQLSQFVTLEATVALVSGSEVEYAREALPYDTM